ncbi:MAG: Gfo/Idh/MocA family oxidoreductase [Planctomycetota bacterium]
MNHEFNRRTAITSLATLSAASLAPRVHASEGDSKLRIALIGCGGRGTGAVNDALSVAKVPIELHAMADAFVERVDRSHQALSNEHTESPERVNVTPERKFVGYDAYQKAMATLRPGDIVVLATPLAFRGVHYEHAIDLGLHVFMEKPVTADGPTSARMIELAKRADEKNLKSAVGLMVRHCRVRQELKRRIDDGEIGDIIMMRAYRMHGPVATAFSPRKPEDISETDYQVQRFHSFLWASGGLFSDFYIHQIDETSWMKGAWPIYADAKGGRHHRGDFVDQNFDNYSVEYTYEDGTKLFFGGRTMIGCRNDMSSIVHGSKGSGVVSTSGHTPGRCKTYSSQNQVKKDLVWGHRGKEVSPYRLEWTDFLQAITDDQPYNEVYRGVEASLVTSMGRMAAHTGHRITLDQMKACPHEFAPGVASLSSEGAAPLTPFEDGSYPVPQPGILKDREFTQDSPA